MSMVNQFDIGQLKEVDDLFFC